jgi:hypothetical protein
VFNLAACQPTRTTQTVIKFHNQKSLGYGHFWMILCNYNWIWMLVYLINTGFKKQARVPILGTQILSQLERIQAIQSNFSNIYTQGKFCHSKTVNFTKRELFHSTVKFKTFFCVKPLWILKLYCDYDLRFFLLW